MIILGLFPLANNYSKLFYVWNERLLLQLRARYQSKIFFKKVEIFFIYIFEVIDYMTRRVRKHRWLKHSVFKYSIQNLLWIVYVKVTYLLITAFVTKLNYHSCLNIFYSTIILFFELSQLLFLSGYFLQKFTLCALVLNHYRFHN